MPFKIVRNDIVKMNTDAVVSTASSEVAVGRGCELAIYTAAGYDKLIEARRKIGVLMEGEAAITDGFGLPARYIIHAVSPRFVDGKNGEEQRLRNCYRNSLRIARKKGLNSIAFPVIATGSFKYPLEEGMRIAVDEINSFLLRYDMTIYLVVFNTRSTQLGEKLYPDLKSYIDYNYVCDKRELEYGDRHFVSAGPKENYYCSSAASYTRGAANPCDKGLFSISGRNSFRQSGGIQNDMLEAVESKSMESGNLKCQSDGNATLEDNEYEEERLCSFDYDKQECLDELDRKLKERMAHMSDSFSTYLLYLIKSKGMENSEVYNRAIVDKKVFSKIKNKADYHPKKMTVLCLCIGAMLSLDESKDLLARAGYALSPCDKQDIIFSYFIENKIYDMIELDIQLEEHGLDPIIA